MAADEFSIIRRYFSTIGKASANRVIGVGDDAAVLAVPPDQQLVVCMDTLVSGVHFPASTSATDVAWKSLAVNLSDLAAMAATPDWFLLSLTLPQASEAWIAEFSRSLHEAAQTYGIDLVGGDTCRGPLSISIQTAGLVPREHFIRRSGCQPGDLILVSGTLGEAALGLQCDQGLVQLEDELASQCLHRLNRPLPRLELVDFLRQFASAAIDISDGLVADLQHMLEQSGVGAIIDSSRLPVNTWIREHKQMHYALYGGDDYEICCSVAANRKNDIEHWNNTNPHCQLTVIGEITESGFVLVNGPETEDLSPTRGYRHFA